MVGFFIVTHALYIDNVCSDDMSNEISCELLSSSEQDLNQYLLGAMCDSTTNHLHKTIRFCQKDRNWLNVLRKILLNLGHNSWIYKEGRDRDLWVCETKTFYPQVENGSSLSFVRGFFDADGGMPKNSSSRLYFQFTQKSYEDIYLLKTIMEGHKINCGIPHVPSVKTNPGYWRIFVSAQSFDDFMLNVGSWHPSKRILIKTRMNMFK